MRQAVEEVAIKALPANHFSALLVEGNVMVIETMRTEDVDAELRGVPP
jgi:hypothetical protein